MKISVIIPCYNVENDLISRCVDSLMKQTFKDFEIIIVDDGSKQEYASILKNLEEKYDQIKVYSQANGGVSSARNKGTELAAGEYICYVDADDAVMENFLDDAYQIAVDNKADVVIGGNGDLAKNTPAPQEAKVDILHGNEIKKIYKYMVGNRLMRFGEGVILGQGPWTRLIKSDLAKKVPFDTTLKIGEDIVWNYELLKQSDCVCVAHMLWYLYYTNPVSASRKFREDAIQESSKSLTAIRNCIDMTDDEIYRSYCSRCISDIRRLYRTYYSNKEKSDPKMRGAIYELPWSEARSKRYISLCSSKEKIVALMYKFHLLLPFYKVKECMRK